MATTPPLVLLHAMRDECRVVHQFLNLQVRPRVGQAVEAAPSADADTWQGALLRVIGWLRSLWKLDEPADFQAVTVASRTLFEIAVDVTIMHFDPTNPPSKMFAWEESAKLRAAQKVRDFFSRRGQAPPPECHHQLAYITRESTRIQGLRATFWGGKHPRDRWTGRSVERDAEAATVFFPEGDFATLYAQRYPQLCWNTHGSGLAGVRGIAPETFPAISALALSDSSRLSVVAAKVILRHFGLWEPLAARFEELRYEVAKAQGSALGMLPLSGW